MIKRSTTGRNEDIKEIAEAEMTSPKLKSRLNCTNCKPLYRLNRSTSSNNVDVRNCRGGGNKYNMGVPTADQFMQIVVLVCLLHRASFFTVYLIL